MIDTITHIYITHYTILLVALGVTLLGLTAGAIGVFATLRKQALLGDTLSHAALPGIACAFLITHSTHPVVLMLGGSISGIIATGLTVLLGRTTTLKMDTILGITLSVFFGVGLVLMTVIQKTHCMHHALLTSFIFGNASALLARDVYYIALITIFVLCAIGAWWKECTVMSFDPHFARSVGYSTLALDLLMVSLLLVTIIVGLQTVGVILMSAMIIAPAAAAYQWSHQLHRMVLAASAIGGLCGLTGALISNAYNHLPTGPVIVILLSMVVLISFATRSVRGTP